MNYDVDLSQMQWEREKYFLLPYTPRRTGRESTNTNFILAFKGGDKSALQQAIQLAICAVEQSEEELREKFSAHYVLALPPSTAGQHNTPCETLCQALASRFDWLIHIDALERLETVSKSGTAWIEGRPRTSYEDHLRTIGYREQKLDTSAHGIIAIDDVYTTGNIFNACYGILKSETQCKHIIGFFVGRTIQI